jgi:hypothetical protein
LVITSTKKGDQTVTRKTLLDFGADTAVITAAFVFRNAVVILALSAFALIAFAGT